MIMYLYNSRTYKYIFGNPEAHKPLGCSITICTTLLKARAGDVEGLEFFSAATLKSFSRVLHAAFSMASSRVLKESG